MAGSFSMRTAAVVVSVAALTMAQDTALTSISFAAPFQEINQFSGMRHVGGWEVGGSAEVHRSFVRLTAEKQGQKGWMISQTPVSLPEWSAMLEVRASGTSPHLYGDGAAPSHTPHLLVSLRHVRGACVQVLPSGSSPTPTISRAMCSGAKTIGKACTPALAAAVTQHPVADEPSPDTQALGCSSTHSRTWTILTTTSTHTSTR